MLEGEQKRDDEDNKVANEPVTEANKPIVVECKNEERIEEGCPAKAPEVPLNASQKVDEQIELEDLEGSRPRPLSASIPTSLDLSQQLKL